MSTQPYVMSLNKKYVLNTLGQTVVNKIVTVTGIVSYDDTVTSGFDVAVLAQNEKFSGSLQSITYYKCVISDVKVDSFGNNVGGPENGKIVIVWSDIIDPINTNVLIESYAYTSNISVKLPVIAGDIVYPITTITNDIVAYAKSKYNANISFVALAGDNNTAIDVLTQRLADCNNVLRSLQSFTTLVPTLNNLAGNDLSTKLTDITASITAINASLAAISAGLA